MHDKLVKHFYEHFVKSAIGVECNGPAVNQFSRLQGSEVRSPARTRFDTCHRFDIKIVVLHLNLPAS